MHCSITGETPREPVFAPKTELLYEKKIIEKAIKTTGVCPVTQKELSVDDLVPVKSSPVCAPRAPSATSLPSLLALLANDWDSSMLETFKLRQALQQTREDLTKALYENDACFRVIARMKSERDEAKRIAAELEARPAAPASAAMDTEEDAGITSEIVKSMAGTAKILSKSRKRVIKQRAAAVAPRDRLAQYSVVSSHPLHSTSPAGIVALDLHEKNPDLALTGGNDGNAIIFNRSTKKIVHTLKAHRKRITSVRFHPTSPLVFTTAADNKTIIWNTDTKGEYSPRSVLSDHEGEVVGLTLHPSGQYMITASADRTWAFYDVQTGICREKVLDQKAQAGFTRVQFHPDGLIFGAGTADSLVKIFDVKQQANVATFKGHTGRLTGLAFSQNGYYLASGDSEGVVKMWDLRKLVNLHTIRTSELKTVSNVKFDPSGSYLAIAGSDLRMYTTKTWELVKTWEDHRDVVTDVAFAPNVGYFASTSLDRNLKFWQLQ